MDGQTRRDTAFELRTHDSWRSGAERKEACIMVFGLLNCTQGCLSCFTRLRRIALTVSDVWLPVLVCPSVCYYVILCCFAVVLLMNLGMGMRLVLNASVDSEIVC